MPFDGEADLSPFRDIIESIEAVERFTAGMDIDSFRADEKTLAAVERKLQIISEASRRLGGRAEEVCPELPWRDIRGIGNWLRHEYFRIDLPTIWKTVTVDLPLLKSAVRSALDRLG